MTTPNLFRSSVAIATLLVAGVASASTAHFDYSTFSLDVTATGFDDASMTQTSNGLSFADFLTETPRMTNVFTFVINLKSGYKVDRYSFVDTGTFRGTNSRFSVADNFSTASEVSTSKGGKIWSFTAGGSEEVGRISYRLESSPRLVYTSNGAAFSVITAPVPEPETYAMLLAGIGLIGAAVKRRKSNQA